MLQRSAAQPSGTSRVQAYFEAVINLLDSEYSRASKERSRHQTQIADQRPTEALLCSETPNSLYTAADLEWDGTRSGSSRSDG